MIIEFISTIVTVALTGLLYWYISKSADRIEEIDKGYIKLTMHPAYKYLSFLCLLICLAGIVGGIYDYQRMDAVGLGFLLLILALFGIPGVYGLLLYYNHIVLFDEQEIISRGPSGKVKRAKWTGIRTVVQNTNLAEIYLDLGFGERLLVQRHLKGFNEFHRELRRHRPELGTAIT